MQKDRSIWQFKKKCVGPTAPYQNIFGKEEYIKARLRNGKQCSICRRTVVGISQEFMRKMDQEKHLNGETERLVRDRSPLGFGVCPICLETLGTQPLVSTKCGHVYCQKCLTHALRLEKKCPTCRKPLKGNTAYHPLFLNRD